MVKFLMCFKIGKLFLYENVGNYKNCKKDFYDDNYFISFQLKIYSKTKFLS